ncbi:VOC family protein [Pseudonocardia halophobica]|uniref:Glyoxalase n=1 Tax=Pseudonocardia halophobica TaxID=29401 RepID=A0A9W6L0N8_9PSEU|nr:VOC family protein [Pseudonocardia halophobica]GLL10635.1 glyoxalase [Pseudonocardia halophobica]
MSRFLGEVRQVGYVVPDIEASMRHWSVNLGVGPWFYKYDIGLTEFTYYGRPVTPPVVSIAIANSGPFQVELVQPRDDAPSAWADSLRAGPGPQHVAFWHDDVTVLRDRLLDRGYVEAHAGRAGTRGGFSYLVHPQDQGNVIEVSETGGGKAEYFARIAAASVGWDGADPVRRQDVTPTVRGR